MRTEHNRTEHIRNEENRKEQNRTEQNRTEQNRTEQNRTEQNRTVENRAEQKRRELNIILCETLAPCFVSYIAYLLFLFLFFFFSFYFHFYLRVDSCMGHASLIASTALPITSHITRFIKSHKIFQLPPPSREYMTQADPSHSTSKPTSRIAQKEFFDLCTCRQLTVRRLLEAFSVSQVD
jgi:hypothetical protein